MSAKSPNMSEFIPPTLPGLSGHSLAVLQEICCAPEESRKAAELLLKADLSLAQIALDCGFSDQAQFTKAFRQVYGTTPGGYRRLTARRTCHVAF